MNAGAALLLPVMATAATSGRALSFLVIGDWGDPNAHQREVALAMARFARQHTPRFVVSVGDNFYPRGVTSTTDSRWQVAFQSVYGDPALGCPWYAVLGNHDRSGNPWAEIAFQTIDRRWHMPSRYYHRVEPVGAGAAEFFFLDTTLLALAARDPSAATADQVQLDWLDTALSASTARWRIVVGHHPVFSGGRHGTSAPLVRRLKPLLDRHKVHAYFNGHDHDMQHIVVDGVHYLTTGSGSKTRSTQAIAGTLFAASALGFMDVEATDEALTFAFVDDSGAVVHRAAIPAGAG